MEVAIFLITKLIVAEMFLSDRAKQFIPDFQHIQRLVNLIVYKKP